MAERPTNWAGTIRADNSSDLSALNVGDALSVKSINLQYRNNSPVGVFTRSPNTSGVLLSIVFASTDRYRVEGCGVIVAPGVASTAAHVRGFLRIEPFTTQASQPILHSSMSDCRLLPIRLTLKIPITGLTE